MKRDRYGRTRKQELHRKWTILWGNYKVAWAQTWKLTALHAARNALLLLTLVMLIKITTFAPVWA